MHPQLAIPSTFSRLDPETTARIKRGTPGKATKAQSAVECTLFVVFGTTIVLCLIAFIVVNSPQHKMVPNRVAAGLREGRVNILVLGTSTRGNETITDALTLVSVKPQTHQVAMISIPRDLWVKLGRYGTHRLSAADSVGDSSGYPGEGTGLTADTIEAVTGQPVHAYVRLGAADLQSTIDMLGGIDIDVKHSFYESKTADRFYRGAQHMNGARAVRFAKSRYVPGPQGDRFAREMREQQVVAAVLEKIATVPAATRDRLLRANFLRGDSNTNLRAGEVAVLADSIRDPGDVQHVSLEPLMDVFEVHTIGDAAGEALRPRDGDFRELQSVARNVFATPTALLTR